MRIFFPIFFGAIFILLFGMLEVVLLRLLNREWWRNKKIRYLAWSLPLVGVVTLLLWATGEYYTKQWLSLPAALLAVLVFVLEVALMLSLPISGLIHLVGRIINHLVTRKRRTIIEDNIDPRRRLFLKGAAAAVPLVTMVMGTTGVARAFADVQVYIKPISIAQLPPALEGLRLFHLTDLHLRHYVNLSDLENLLNDARILHPDIVLISGDVADDLAQLPGALTLLKNFATPSGCFASPGNHEYFRGIVKVKAIFERAGVPLLINRMVTIEVRGQKLRLGGLDDPVTIRNVSKDFFRRAIDETFPSGALNDFSILMSHRPEALDYASERGINLVLAGHTHGGQVGLFGRSLFEIYWPERYLWGHYQRQQTHLYTSSGIGHWFPFRLGCPAEAPVIELHRE